MTDTFTVDASQGVHAKYHLDENRLFSGWFIFGATETSADIADAFADVITGLPKDQAVRIVAARERFVMEVYAILFDRDAHPSGKPPG